AAAPWRADSLPRGGRAQPRREQRERKAAHGKGHRPAAFVRNQRHGQDRRIEDRAPSQNLGDAEHKDGAPRAGDGIGQRRHGGSTAGERRSTPARPPPAAISWSHSDSRKHPPHRHIPNSEYKGPPTT